MTSGAHLGVRQYRINAEIGVGQERRVFVPPPCARCGAPCADEDGNPRWELAWPFTFLCLGGCRPENRPRGWWS